MSAHRDNPAAGPPPNAVRGNDWRQVAVPDAASFAPSEGVSVVVPYHEAAGALALTLAALERQRYPRELLEVVVVDDGSRAPPPIPAGPGLDVRLVRQPRRGFGLARARNRGAREARHEILVFLDGDMIPGDGLVAAHARWHHAVADAVTFGFRSDADTAGVDAAAVRAGTPAARWEWRDSGHNRKWLLARTRDLVSGGDDVYCALAGHNFAMRRAFYEAIGASDASFDRYGGEDRELAYRAHVAGALLVPVREARAWHREPRGDEVRRRRREIHRQWPKLADLIAHESARPRSPGRIYAVPMHVATVEARGVAADRAAAAVQALLADPLGDVAVRIETDADAPRDLAWLRDCFGWDPRVAVAPERPALDAFPASPFHLRVPAAGCAPGLLTRMRAALGAAVAARLALGPHGTATMARAWALHRARRTGREIAEFGEVVAVGSGIASRHGLRRARERAMLPSGGRWRAPRRALEEALRVRGPVTAWAFAQWAGRAVRRRLAGVRPLAPPPDAMRWARGGHSLGARIASAGPAAGAVFAASPLVGPDPSGAGADVLLADAAAHAARAQCPAVLLAAAPALGVPAFDPAVHNPVGWRRTVERCAVVLGPRDRLPSPPGRCVRADAADRAALLAGHHLADVASYHASAAARAGTLARIAATGLPVHLADGGPGLAPLLGVELHVLMTSPAVLTANTDERESLSVRMRRIALRDHALGARARQVCAAALDDAPRPPKVSVLLATRRPALLAGALAGVARQSYPELELVLALHGDGFADEALERALAGMRAAVRVIRVGAARPLGAVLNAAAAAASGLLLAKMDDDDAYGPDHVWDLVLAHEYSGAALVGKPIETVYLGAAGRTVRRAGEPNETYAEVLAGGALLIARHDLARVGGWRRVPGGVDVALIEDVRRAGGAVYRTHGRGFMLVRHGAGHTWEVDERLLCRGVCASAPGWRPALADIEAAPGLEGPPA